MEFTPKTMIKTKRDSVQNTIIKTTWGCKEKRKSAKSKRQSKAHQQIKSNVFGCKAFS